MDETDAVALLLKSAGQANSPENEKIAVEIVKELCHLPLAIVQAGKFFAQSGSLNSFLGIHMKNQAQLLSQKPHSDYSSTVDATWQMSFNQLSQPATMLLQLCSFLHWDGISEEIFSRAAIYRFQQAIPLDQSREALKKPLEFLAQFLGPAGEWDNLCFLKVTNEIKAYSLMTFDPKRRMFSIHPPLRSWIRSTITDQQSYHSIMAAIMGLSI
ncbi:hypothetical protein B0H13DRAFT_1722386, partial [Mycena leptocephala]